MITIRRVRQRSGTAHGVTLRRSLELLAVALFAVGALVAAAWTLIGPVDIDDPTARAAIETATMMWALATAGLLLVHFDHTRERRDLLLLAAVVVISVRDMLFSALPAFSASDALSPGIGSRIASAVLVAIALCAAAIGAGRSGDRHSRRTAVATVGLCIAVVALAWSAGLVISPSARPGMTHETGIAVAAEHPVALALAILSAVALLTAASEFGRRALRGERHVGLLAGASALLAAALLEYTVDPVMRPDWVTIGDVLRCGAYPLLLLFAARQYSDMRRDVANAALAAQRRRIARDLHDGLAQDLAFIATHSQRLDSDGAGDHPLTLAARRALAISRGAIVDLSASGAPTTQRALLAIADELQARFAVRICLSTEGGVWETDLQQPVREEVVRIAREAMVNAIHHGGATQIDLVLDLRGRAPLLRVTDNGSGIDLKQHDEGFGLASMRARAESIGARLVTAARSRGGTEVQVVITPSRPLI